MSSNTNYRARRGSGGGSGSGGSGSGRVNKSIRTTTTTTTITFRDLLMLYQGLIIPAGYIAFPLWILYRTSIDKNDDSGASGGTKDDDDGMGTIGGGGGGGVYSFVAILTVMGIFCHFGGKILLGIVGGFVVGQGRKRRRRSSEISIGVEQRIVL